MARTRILTWANKHITLTPWGSSFSGSNASQPTKGTSTPPGGPTCAIWKESSKRLQSYGPDKNITLTPWGQGHGVKWVISPQKAHLDPLGVLHVQYVKNPPSAYRVMARTRIFTWANKHITWPPGGQVFRGQMRHNPQKAHLDPLVGPTCAIWKESSQRLQSYGPDKNITLTPWGTRSWGQMSHFPQKAHLDPLGVLHVQYEKNPPSGYRVMARTRIFTWANKHITLTPWGSSFSGSNVSQPPKGTSRPPRGPTCAIWKESSKRLQSYGPDKNITLTPPGGQGHGVKWVISPKKAHLDPLGVLHVQYVKNPPSAYRVMARTRIFTWANKHITLTPWGSSFSGSNASQPTKGTSTPPGGPTCAIWKESS